MGLVRFLLFTVSLFCITLTTFAQNRDTSNRVSRPTHDTTFNTTRYLTLRQCVDYALIHQPGLNRALLNQGITKETNAVNLSGLLPQVTASGSFVHNIQQANVTTDPTTGA